MGTVETGTLSQLLLWSAKWLGDPSKGNTSQGTDGATLGLLNRLSGVPGQAVEGPLQLIRPWREQAAIPSIKLLRLLHACSYAPAYATWELWLWGLWPNATAKQMSTGFWTSDGSSSWPNCNNRLRSLRQRYAHLWGSVKWMDAREQLDDQTLASAARTHAYAHA